MGFFHKTLRDILKQVKAGKIEEAEKTLGEHLEAEVTFNKDLAGLKGLLDLYDLTLKKIKNWLFMRKSVEKQGLKPTDEKISLETLTLLTIDLNKTRKKIYVLLSKLWTERGELK